MQMIEGNLGIKATQAVREVSFSPITAASVGSLAQVVSATPNRCLEGFLCDGYYTISSSSVVSALRLAPSGEIRPEFSHRATSSNAEFWQTLFRSLVPARLPEYFVAPKLPASTLLGRAVLSRVDKALRVLAAEEAAVARDAAADFEKVAVKLAYLPLPWIEVSDSGGITLQWERGDCGIVLLFMGDGLCTLSRKCGRTEFYAENMRDFDLHEQGQAGIDEAVRSVVG